MLVRRSWCWRWVGSGSTEGHVLDIDEIGQWDVVERCRGEDLDQYILVGAGTFPENVEGLDRSESASVGPFVSHGAIPSQAQLGDKRGEVGIVTIGAEVMEGSGEGGTDGFEHVVERGLGSGIDDVILLNGVEGGVKVEKDSMGVHGGENGTMDKSLEAMNK